MLIDQINALKSKRDELQSIITKSVSETKSCKTELSAVNKAIKALENLDNSESENE